MAEQAEESVQITEEANTEAARPLRLQTRIPHPRPLVMRETYPNRGVNFDKFGIRDPGQPQTTEHDRTQDRAYYRLQATDYQRGIKK